MGYPPTVSLLPVTRDMPTIGPCTPGLESGKNQLGTDSSKVWRGVFRFFVLPPRERALAMARHHREATPRSFSFECARICFSFHDYLVLASSFIHYCAAKSVG